MSKRIRYYSARDIMRMQFETIKLDGFFGSLLGEPEKGFWGMIYARPKQGKSYLMTDLADALSQHIGQGAYWSAEEGIGRSIQRRIELLGLENSKLRFLKEHSKDSIHQILKSPANKFLVIDSPAHLNLTVQEAKELHERWHKRKTVLMVQHVNGKGEAAGGIQWDHLVDVILKIDKPYIYQLGRYGGAYKLKLSHADQQATTDLFTLNGTHA